VLSDRPDVWLVEDNAHGLFGQWHGRPLGSLGRVSTLSFHETKNFVCGEGGAIVLHAAEDVGRAAILHEKGTDRRAFTQGLVSKYRWRDTGSSFAMADVLAAYLLAQLERSDEIQSRRRRLFEAYQEQLTGRVEEFGVRLPVVPADRVPAYHLFHLLLPTPAARRCVIEDLRRQDIATAFHYVALHNSEGGRRFAARQTACPVSSSVSERLLRLPFHNRLDAADVERVVEALVTSLSAAA
jgi:dTDP-4-amino-4,6-dideoxygalactose transaminase